jgi:hypothetical protein
LHPLPDGSQLDAKFDTVSLSESPVDGKKKPAHDEEHDEALSEVEIANDDRKHTLTEDNSVALNGTSKPRPASIEVNLDSPPLFSPPSRFQLDTPTSGDDRETPPGQPIPARAAPTPLRDPHHLRHLRRLHPGIRLHDRWDLVHSRR